MRRDSIGVPIKDFLLHNLAWTVSVREDAHLFLRSDASVPEQKIEQGGSAISVRGLNDY